VPLLPWATLDDLPADRPALPGGDEEWSHYLAAASDVLYALTGRRYAGLRERAVELYAPCRCGGRLIGPVVPGAWLEYALTGGAGPLGSYAYDPYSLPFGVWGSCRPHTVRLPNRDARELLAVRDAAGAPLDLTRYRIDRGGYLARVPGIAAADAPLPGCRRPLHLRYRFGRPPGDAGIVHAVQLALALGQARLDPDSSPLPGTVTQIVRQGVTFTQQAASVVIEAGSTGLTPVDLWVASVNPGRAKRPARSWSPDTDAPYRPLSIEEVPVP
jgi:hypothetical protein